MVDYTQFSSITQFAKDNQAIVAVVTVGIIFCAYKLWQNHQLERQQKKIFEEQQRNAPELQVPVPTRTFTPTKSEPLISAQQQYDNFLDELKDPAQREIDKEKKVLEQCIAQGKKSAQRIRELETQMQTKNY
jgi:hypothetical protein